MRQWGLTLGLVGVGLLAAGCPGPNPVEPQTTFRLTVRVSGFSCAGIGAVDEFVDNTFIGRVGPGDSGASVFVSVGTHGVNARALNRSHVWAVDVTVRDRDVIETLGC